MKHYLDNINKETVTNLNYRKVLFTGKQMQLVVMSIKPGEEIGEEIHADTDQFIRIERGIGLAVLEDVEYELVDDSALIIPAGTKHNIINTSATEILKLYSIYSPPEHPENTVQLDKPANDHEHE